MLLYALEAGMRAGMGSEVGRRGDELEYKGNTGERERRTPVPLHCGPFVWGMLERVPGLKRRGGYPWIAESRERV